MMKSAAFKVVVYKFYFSFEIVLSACYKRDLSSARWLSKNLNKLFLILVAMNFILTLQEWVIIIGQV